MGNSIETNLVGFLLKLGDETMATEVQKSRLSWDMDASYVCLQMYLTFQKFYA